MCPVAVIARNKKLKTVVWIYSGRLAV